MYKLNLLEDSDGVWCYSFSENETSKFYINFPLQLALICQGENIIGPDSCYNCSSDGTIGNKLVTLCVNCTKMACVDELEKYKCECNSIGNCFQKEFEVLLTKYKKDGFYTRGCNMPNCIFKSYLDECDFMAKTEKKQINNLKINWLENINYISDSNDDEDSVNNKLEISISTILSENENSNSSIFIDLTDEDDDEIEGENIVYKPKLLRSFYP